MTADSSSENGSEAKESGTENAETQKTNAEMITAFFTEVDDLKGRLDELIKQEEENTQSQNTGAATAGPKPEWEAPEFDNAYLKGKREEGTKGRLEGELYKNESLGDKDSLMSKSERIETLPTERLNAELDKLMTESDKTDISTPEGKERREQLREEIGLYMDELNKRSQTEESIEQEGPNWELLKSLRAFEGKLVKDGDRYGECLNKLQASIETGYDLTPRDIQEIGKILFANETNLEEQSFWKVMGSLQNIINADRDAENERKEAREKAIAESSEKPAKEPRSTQARFFVDSKGEVTEDLQQQIKEFARKMIDNSGSTEWATKEEEQFKINHAQEIEDELKEIAKESESGATETSQAVGSESTENNDDNPEKAEEIQYFIKYLAHRINDNGGTMEDWATPEEIKFTEEHGEEIEAAYKELKKESNYKTAIDALKELKEMDKSQKVTAEWLKGKCGINTEEVRELSRKLIEDKVLGEPDEHGQMEILLKEAEVPGQKKKKGKLRSFLEKYPTKKHSFWDALDPRNELNFITLKALKRNKQFGYFGDSPSAENSNEGNKQESTSAPEVSSSLSETNNPKIYKAGDMSDWLANPVASTRQKNTVDNDAGAVSEPPPRPTQPSVDMTPVEEKSKGKDGGFWSWLWKGNKPKPK